ncbi:MAG: prepilin peptidase [Blastomonas sp.]
MYGDLLVYGLAGGLAIALLHAAYTDLKRREIENWLCAGIALAAPLFWWASGLSPWPDMAIQLGVGLATFGLFAIFFAMGAMGGGDVKLLAAIALWLPWQVLVVLIVIMSILGGLLTLVMAIEHRIRRRKGQLEVPYGVAIALAGLWVLGERYLNHFI